MKDFMYLQPFMETYRFNMIKLPCLLIRQKPHFFISLVPLKSHNTFSDLYSTEIQLNLKLTFLCHLWARCININVWSIPFIISHTPKIWWCLPPHTSPLTAHCWPHGQERSRSETAEDRSSALLTLSSLPWDQVLALLCASSATQPGHFCSGVFVKAKLKSKCLRGHQCKKAAFARQCAGRTK